MTWYFLATAWLPEFKGPHADALLAFVLGAALVLLSSLARALADVAGKRGSLSSRAKKASFSTPSANVNSTSPGTTDAA